MFNSKNAINKVFKEQEKRYILNLKIHENDIPITQYLHLFLVFALFMKSIRKTT